MTCMINVFTKKEAEKKREKSGGSIPNHRRGGGGGEEEKHERRSWRGVCSYKTSCFYIKPGFYLYQTS